MIGRQKKIRILRPFRWSPNLGFGFRGGSIFIPRTDPTFMKGITMDLLFPDNGLVEQLNRILSGSVHYHLYTNNYTPTLSTLLADLTEASWTGYSVVTQTWSDFTINGVAAHSGYAIAAPITFTNGSGSTVNPYGYYVTNTGNTILLAVARFDGAPSPIVAAGTLSVVPTWGDFSQLSS